MQGKSKGQGLVEYAILLGLVTAAFMGMRLYVTRGLQARYKDGTDYAIKMMRDDVMQPRYKDDADYEMIRDGVGDSTPPLQYEPYYKESYTKEVHAGEKYTEGADLSALEPYVRQGGFNTEAKVEEVITRYGYEKTGARLNDE